MAILPQVNSRGSGSKAQCSWCWRLQVTLTQWLVTSGLGLLWHTRPASFVLWNLLFHPCLLHLHRSLLGILVSTDPDGLYLYLGVVLIRGKFTDSSRPVFWTLPANVGTFPSAFSAAMTKAQDDAVWFIEVIGTWGVKDTSFLRSMIMEKILILGSNLKTGYLPQEPDIGTFICEIWSSMVEIPGI